MANQIITYGTNYSQETFYPVANKDAYECANAAITRGATGIPSSLQECFDRFSGVLEIAEAIGFYTATKGSCGSTQNFSGGGGCGGSGSNYTLWTGPSTVPSLTVTKPIDLYFDVVNEECNQVNTELGLDWMGCLWATPSAPYSCLCPDIKPKYEAYIKLRLNVASFWNTPVETPVKRAEFLDAIKYGRKVDVTIAGDFTLKVGQLANLRINGISGFPYSSTNSVLNATYYVTGLKHVITNSGTHETALSLTQIAPLDGTSKSAVDRYYS
jgi:hypothetical protein